jgi:hypothetical protein
MPLLFHLLLAWVIANELLLIWLLGTNALPSIHLPDYEA